MTGAGLLGLLVLKHGVLAHLIDLGYSASRRGNSRFWYIALFFHCLAELTVTLLVLRDFTPDTALLVLLIELTGLAGTAVCERDAPLRKLLMRHLTCELAMVGMYAAIVSYLVWGL